MRNLDLVPQAEFFLYVTRDVQLLEEMTRPALGRADVVIADRFLFSAEVLARFGRGLPEDFVRPVLDDRRRAGWSPIWWSWSTSIPTSPAPGAGWPR